MVANRPLCMHTTPTPRLGPAAAGAGALGPWLPAMQAYAIPKPEWIGLARHPDRPPGHAAGYRVRRRCGHLPGAAHVFDTRHLPVIPAALEATGPAATTTRSTSPRAGCDKGGLAWSQAIEAVMLANP